MSAEVEGRLTFETLIAEISSRFVNLPASDVDGEIENALRHVRGDGVQGQRSPGWGHNCPPMQLTREFRVQGYSACYVVRRPSTHHPAPIGPVVTRTILPPWRARPPSVSLRITR